jgi:transposase
MEKELTRPGVTRYTLWLEYKAAHPEGYQYVQFCYHYRQWTQQQKASLHLEHKAGDKLFVDFAGKKLYLTNPKTGAVELVEVFVAILGCSQLTFAKAVKSQRKEDFIGCLVDTLTFLGGVLQAIAPDNLKAAVTKAHRYEPELNPTPVRSR